MRFTRKSGAFCAPLLLLLACGHSERSIETSTADARTLKLLSQNGDSVSVFGGVQPFTFVFASAFSAGITQEELPKLEKIMAAVDESKLRLVIIVLDPAEGLPKLEILAPATLKRAIVVLDPLDERRYMESRQLKGFPSWGLYNRSGDLLARNADDVTMVERILSDTSKYKSSARLD